MGRYTDRDPIEEPCPSCNEVGSLGEYGASCDNDSCRVVFYKDERPGWKYDR